MGNLTIGDLIAAIIYALIITGLGLVLAMMVGVFIMWVGGGFTFG